MEGAWGSEEGEEGREALGRFLVRLPGLADEGWEPASLVLDGNTLQVFRHAAGTQGECIYSVDISDKHQVSQIATKDFSIDPSKSIFISYFSVSKGTKIFTSARAIKVGSTTSASHQLAHLRDILRSHGTGDALTIPIL